MERKKFLQHSIGLLGAVALFNACKKDNTSPNNNGCAPVAPEEVEGPYPYTPGGEISNPLQRADVKEGQTGLPLDLIFTVININANCAVVENARVDIWHCNKDGYYSGYGNQTGGVLGTQSYIGETWLRGYQLTDVNGKATFNTVYPGWYQGRATHIHIEVFVNNILKKTTQITFPETVSDTVHVSTLYAAHGTNTTRNSNDGIFNNSATDLANETVAVTGDTTSGYTGNYSIGIAL